MPKYESYEEAVERETVKNLDLKNRELEKRIKLEESVDLLCTFVIIAIIFSIVLVALLIFGVISLA